MKTKHRFMIGLGTLLTIDSGASFAGRCEFNTLLNTVQCCAVEEQAVYNPLFSRIECVPSLSTQSCLFNPILNATSCCLTHEQAIWHVMLNKEVCCDPEAPEGSECRFLGDTQISGS